ncbi:uncharacterized protein PRCAT00001748001 [Priceomyces carsonii]|uniref:uncharacterized protein n=1 Tax=Priceomyces carsonii TaxID=28549 RepID=UPI002ED98555|nr:unnamed protein product [Priceomyces carsonii]
MLELPDIWYPSSFKSICPPNFIYGLRINKETNSYCFYITNFSDAWVEATSEEDLLEKAGSLGYEDLDDDALKNLLETLGEGSCDNTKGKALNFTTLSLSREDIIISLSFKELLWNFKLKKQLQEYLTELLSALNFQQFRNHNYLQHDINYLKKLIKLKDLYMSYLTENLKLSHGNEIIKRYSKNNRSEYAALKEFNDSEWAKTTENRYFEELKVIENADASFEDRQWKQLEEALVLEKSWKFSNGLELGETKSKDVAPIQVRKKIDVSPRRKKPKRIGVLRNRR